MTREEINEEKQKEIFKEQNIEKTKKIIKIVVITTLIIIVSAFIFISYTSYISTTKVHVREYRIENKKIPNSFNGIKIVHFSDLHYGTTIDYISFKKIINKINDRKPDIVVFTGDLIDDNYNISAKEQEKLTKLLNSIDSSLGKYAISGDEDKDNYFTILNQSNFNILNNDYDLIYNNSDDPILLIGVDSLINNKQDIEKAYSYFKQEVFNSNIYTISLVHEPDSSTDMINSYNNDLILAGHTHNGSIRIPIINFPLITSFGGKKYNQDYYKINDTDLYISSGLGTDNYFGIRLFCRPTISLYRLSNK